MISEEQYQDILKVSGKDGLMNTMLLKYNKEEIKQVWNESNYREECIKKLTMQIYFQDTDKFYHYGGFDELLLMTAEELFTIKNSTWKK